MNPTVCFYVWTALNYLINVFLVFVFYRFLCSVSDAYYYEDFMMRLEYIYWYLKNHLTFSLVFFAIVIFVFVLLHVLDKYICNHLIKTEVNRIVDFDDDDDMYIPDDGYEEND